MIVVMGNKIFNVRLGCEKAGAPVPGMRWWHGTKDNVATFVKEELPRIIKQYIEESPPSTPMPTYLWTDKGTCFFDNRGVVIRKHQNF